MFVARLRHESQSTPYRQRNTDHPSNVIKLVRRRIRRLLSDMMVFHRRQAFTTEENKNAFLGKTFVRTSGWNLINTKKGGSAARSLMEDCQRGNPGNSKQTGKE